MRTICKPQFIVLLSILFLSACDWGRTPSKERFEKNCHITIPQDVTVIKDEYEGLVSDYTIYYTLKFTASSLKDFTKSIRQSDYYNTYWRNSKRGYTFYRKEGGKEYTEYSIDVDTAYRAATFQEGSN